MDNMRTSSSLVIGILALVIIALVHQYNLSLTETDEKKPNAYPYWRDMTEDSTAKFNEICASFEAYEQSSNYKEGEDKHFREWKRRAEGRVREDGTIMPMHEYEQIVLGYRRPLAFSQDDMICDDRQLSDIEDEESKGIMSRATVMSRAVGVSYSGIANPNGEGNWKRVGPFGDPEVKWSATGNGRGMYVAHHPTDQKTIYLCTSHGGLWRTRDGGATWETLTDALPGRGTESITLDPKDSKILYLGAAGGIYKSTDEGKSWRDVSNGINKQPFDIRVHPESTHIVMANASNGIYRSTDAGENWTKLLSGDFRNMDATDDWSVLAAVRENHTHQFYTSYDNGITWDSTALTSYVTIVRPHLAFYKPHASAADQTPKIYVMCEGAKDDPNPPTTKYAGLFRSDDLGKTFTEIENSRFTYSSKPVGIKVSHPDSTNFSEIPDGYGELFGNYLGWFTNGFSINPKDPNHLLFPATKFWGSKDGGESWVALPSYGGSNWADQHFSTWDLSGDTLLWVNDGGIWAMAYQDMWKENHAQYVFSKNGDMAFSLSSQCDISTYNKNVHISGGQDIGQVFHRKGRDSHVASADVYRGRICPHNDSVFMTGKLSVLVGTDTVDVYNFIEADNHDSRRIYGFTNNSKNPWLVRSPKEKDAWQFGNKSENNANVGGHATTPIDDVRNWERISFSSVGLDTIGTGGFEQSRALANLAFFADPVSQQVFISENLDADTPTWTKLANAPQSNRYRLATHAYNENILILGTNNAIFISRDKGESFTQLGSFPDLNPVKILMDKRTSEGAYVLTERSVYYKDESLDNWVEFNKGLPLGGYNEMRIFWSEDGDHRLYVSNYGRGILYSPLYGINGVIADFDIHGISSRTITSGQSFQLFDLSSGSISSRNWKVAKGTTEKTATGTEPSVTLTDPGLYTVSLTVSDGQKSHTRTKKGFIKVLNTIKDIDCIPDEKTGAWYKGIGSVSVNGDTYESGGTGSGVYSDFTAKKTFTVFRDKMLTVATTSSHNDFTNYSCKIYVDVNNNGTFEVSEEMATSNGRENDEYTFTFLLPVDVVTNTPIRMRVIYKEANTITDACEASVGEVEDYSLIVTPPAPTITATVESTTSKEISMSASITDGGTVTETGFVYSVFDRSPDISSSGHLSQSVSFSGTGNSSATLKGLQKNKTYTVRAYILNESGIFYSDPVSAELLPYTIPLLEALPVVYDATEDGWKIAGRINPTGSSVDSLYLQYGNGSEQAMSIAFDAGSATGDNWFDIDTVLTTLPPFTSIYYRVRAVVDGEEFYSSVQRFNSEKDLYAYWSFDETSGDTVFDLSGNNRYALLEGATRGTGAFDGNSAQFSSETDLVRTNLGDLQPPFTISFWANRQSEAAGSYSTLFSGSGNSHRIDMECWNTTRKFGIAKPGSYDAASGYEAPLNEWHHYTLTATTDTVVLYIDGVEQKTYAKQFKLPIYTMGKSGNSAIGMIDEVKVYSGVIAPEKITELPKMKQEITIESVPNVKNNVPALDITATTTSALDLTYSLESGSDIVSLSGTTVTLTGDTGSVSIKVEQAGNDKWLSAWKTVQFRVIDSSATAIVDGAVKIDFPVLITPNPVHVDEGSVEISFYERTGISADIYLYDMVGNQILKKTIFSSDGKFTGTWDLTNNSGRRVASGNYPLFIRATRQDGSKAFSRSVIGIQK